MCTCMVRVVLEPSYCWSFTGFSESAHKNNRKENKKEKSTHVVVVVVVLGQVADVAMAGHDWFQGRFGSTRCALDFGLDVLLKWN